MDSKGVQHRDFCTVSRSLIKRGTERNGTECKKLIKHGTEPLSRHEVLPRTMAHGATLTQTVRARGEVSLLTRLAGSGWEGKQTNYGLAVA